MARIKDLKAQNPSYTIDVIEVLSSMDPSKSNKYLPFMIKCTADWVEWINNELKNETFKEMFEVIKDFEDLSERNLLENKDIYSYESNQDIIEAVKFAKSEFERATTPAPIKVKLNREYTADVYGDKIVVGCQTFDALTIGALFGAAKETGLIK